MPEAIRTRRAGIADYFVTYDSAVLSLAAGFCFLTNVISSVFITLINRFIFMFHPDSRRYLENKYTITGIVIFHFVMYSFAFGIMISTMTSHDQTRFEATRDHPGAMDEYFKYNSFAYISGGELRYFLLRIGLCVAGALVLSLLISVTFFIVNVFIYKKTATVISKTSKFLIVNNHPTMDVSTDLSPILGESPIARLDQTRFKWLTPRKYPAFVKAIDSIGALSAKAQNLKKPLTSYDRILDNDDEQHVYIAWEQSPNGITSRILGFLKMSRRKLYLRDNAETQFIISPPCVLDFYVHESVQHQGYGTALFTAMLTSEDCEASKVAFDKPTDALMNFLATKFGLVNPVWQSTNFLVFEEFFSDLKPEHVPDQLLSARSQRESFNSQQASVNHNRVPYRTRDAASDIIHGAEPQPIKELPGADTPRGRKYYRDYGHSDIFG
uniref:Alpha-tubulin N-acetyltransferase n=1 Tax=Panagrellus redivivus TaxID=6233 RepID=A0A7E4ZVD9_PANRE